MSEQDRPAGAGAKPAAAGGQAGDALQAGSG